MGVQKSKMKLHATSNAATTTTTAASYDGNHPRQRMAQNYLLIWVDAGIDQKSQDCQNALKKLRKVVNDVTLLKEPAQCVEFLDNMDDEKAFIITSGSLGQQLVPHIHAMPHVDAIYIFCKNTSWHEEWTKSWAKIKGVHTEIKAICDALQLAVKQCNQDGIAMSFVTASQGASNANLNQLEPTFMYTQIFKDILLEMEHGQQAIKDLVVYCRKLYPDNTRELNIIDEFERDYRPQMAIWWYTRQCFTYNMLNRSLRLLEADTIITMGFFISDLHKQIQQLHQQQISTYQGKPFIVYRGQGLLETDFEKLRKAKGGLMSFNNFLSTSKIEEVSLKFARRASVKMNTVGILFKMTIDPSVSSSPFVAIKELSFYKKEDELLFSMHTVFRVGNMTTIDNNSRLYQMELQLTADDDEQLRTLTKRIAEESVGNTGWERLGVLLVKIGQLNKAEELFEALLEQTSKEIEKALFYNQLGYVKKKQGDYKKAIEYYDKALEIRENVLPSHHSDLAISYSNIGSVYDNMGEYSKALSFHGKALEIREKTLASDHPSLAISYNNIATVHYNMKEYSKALLFYEKALRIREKILLPNHPDLATCYNNIASVYYKMEEYENALSFYKKALEIREKTLTSNHPDLATSYNNIGWMFSIMGHYSEALSSYERALNIRQNSLPPDHPDIEDVKASIEFVKKKYNYIS